MKFYNTYTKEMVDFLPSKLDITMYTCGPSSHSTQHIGNIRSHVTEDLFEKSLKYLGYNVKRAMCITDVGKLKSTGEDKMTLVIRSKNKTAKEISNENIEQFKKDCSLLNITIPKFFISASSEIEMYIKIINKLLNLGYAYHANKNIYFDTSKKEDYYKLVGKVTVEKSNDKYKRNPNDFELWIGNLKQFNIDESLLWDSPWGKGSPGWHLQCSAISIKYLGENLDLHFGSLGAIFPHHTNEIAQSEAYLGHEWCKHWIHLGYLNVNGEKMSKSLNNFIMLSDIIDQGYNPLSFKFLLMKFNYKDTVNFSYDFLNICQKEYFNIKSKIKKLKIKKEESISKEAFTYYNETFKSNINNDLNLNNLIILLNKLLGDKDINNITKLELISNWDKVLGLNLIESISTNHQQ